MSSPPRISYVVEGTTDYLVLDALVELFLGTNDYVPTRIQPPTSEYAGDLGPLGGGWKGVLKWCADQGDSPGGFGASLALANCDYLVIHVDADIAMESELAAHELACECPPASDTCDRIRAHLTMLLGGVLPARQVVLCVPAQSTEAWVFAALHTNEVSTFQPIECRKEPATLLIGRPDRLVRHKDGGAKKQPERYRAVLARMRANWPAVTTHCAEGLRFETEFRSLSG